MRTLDRFTRVVVFFCPSTPANFNSSPLAPQTQRTKRRALKGIPLALIALLAAAPGVAAATSATATLLSAGPASSVSSSVITMTANVSSGGAAVTGGTVTFVDTFNGVSETLGTIQVQSANGIAGTAILRTEIGGVGQHSLVATYNGTKLLAASSSPAQTVTFTPFYGSATSLAATGSSGAYGLTATVSAFGPAAPTGQLAFINTTANTTLGTATLDPATLQVGFTPVRKYPIANLLSPSPSGAAAPAIGDLNGDGKPDFVVPTTGGPIVILLGNGDGTYTAGTSLTGTSPSSAVVTDFNGDGKQDIAVLNTAGTGSVTIFLGNGDGTFQAGKTFSVAGATSDSRLLAVGDFNGDGIPDLVASNHALNQVAVLLGNGDGTFQPAGYYATGIQPWNIVVGDINNDGIQDLAVADDLDTNVTILLGNGDGTFRRGTSPSVSPGSQSGSVALGDFNGDGNLDLAVTDQGQNHIYVFLGKGDGTFNSPVTYTMAGGPYYLTIADFNRDGKLDIISANNAGATVGIMLGKGDGTFSAPTYYPVGGKSIFATVGDLNGDDQVDVAAITASGLSILLSGQAESASLSAIDVHGCGAQAVTSTYSGDTTYSASTSSAVSLTPTTLSTTVTALATPSASTYGQQIVLTATLVPSTYGSTLTDGEIVTFKKGASVVGTAPLVSGVATLNLTTLALGTNSLTASYPGDCAFQASSSAAVTETVTQGAATLTWANPAAIAYGTALSVTQLNATANLPGTFVYSPATGTVLAAGSHTLSVTFTPTDTVHYLSSTATVTLVVNPVAATLTWANPAAITYGTALSVTQLNATANVLGSFVYTPAVGAVLASGSHTLSVTFTPADAVDYLPVSATVTLIVNQALPVVSWSNPAAITYGTPLSATQLNATASVPGTFAYSPAAGTVLAAGSHTLSVTFTPTDTVNYSTASATVTLLVNQAAATLTWGNPAPIPYGRALSATQLNATANVPGVFVYTPAAGTVLGVGPHTLSVRFTPTDAINYPAATATVTLVVNVATLNLTANDASRTFNTANPAFTGTVTGAVNGDLFVESFTTTATLASPVGTYPIVPAVSGAGLANYNVVISNGTLTITKATATLTWANPAPISYGTALSATQLNAAASVPGTFIYTPALGTVLAAGTHTLSVAFTPTDTTNYASASATVTLLVNQATATLTWANPAPITYGTALTSTQLNATASVPGTFVYSPAAGAVLAAGTHTLSVTFTPTDSVNYSTATATAALLVNRATPTLAWANPAAISAGTPLSSTQLNATASVAGSFLYAPAAGTVLAAGTHTLSVTFTPADTTNYSNASATVALLVNQGVATLTWANPAPITYGVPLSSTQLNATASVPGTFAYSPAAGAVLTAGSHTLSVTFTPTDTVNYQSAAATVTLVVNQATPVLTWLNPASITFGTALSATQLNATASVPGTFLYTPAAGSVPPTGTHTLSVTFTPTDSVNYRTTTATVTLVVSQGSSTTTLSWTDPAPIAYGTALSATQLNATANIPGTFVYTPTAGAVLSAGLHSLSVTFTPTDTTNHSVASASVSVLVVPATLHAAATDASRLFGAANPAFTGTLTGAVNGDTFNETFSTVATINSPAGTYPIVPSVSGANLSNYTVVASNGTLTIGIATLTIDADNAARTYGAANPTFTGHVTGAINGDNFTETFTTTAAPTSPAGTYPIVPSVSGANLSSYVLVVKNGSLTVNKAVLTVTAQDASRAVAVPNPAFTAVITGFLGADTTANSTSGQPALTTTATTSSAAGTYPITPSAGTLTSGSYSFTFVPGTLTITGGSNSLTVQVSDATRPFGAANPAFASVIIGARNGDTFTVTYTTTATATSDPGAYPITATVSGANLAKYSLTVAPGTLTVVKAPTTTTVASSASDVSANSPVTLSAIVTSATTGTPNGTVVFSDGNQRVGAGALVNGAASFTTGPLAAGTHSFTAAFGGATDYLGSGSSVSVNATTLPFVITVTPNPIVVAWRHTAHMMVTVTPAAGFTGTVNLACSGIHNYDSVCNLGIASLSFASATGAAQTTAMDVTTSFAPLGAVRESEIYQHGSPILPVLSFWIPGLLLGGLGAGQRKRLNRTQRRVLLVLALALGAVSMSGLTGCGSGKPSEGGSYTVALQGHGANGTQYSQAVTVMINIQNP